MALWSNKADLRETASTCDISHPQDPSGHGKRFDGFHGAETSQYPKPLCDKVASLARRLAEGGRRAAAGAGPPGVFEAAVMAAKPRWGPDLRKGDWALVKAALNVRSSEEAALGCGNATGYSDYAEYGRR